VSVANEMATKQSRNYAAMNLITGLLRRSAELLAMTVINSIFMKLKCKVVTRASRNEILGLEKLNSLDLEFKNKNGNNENDLPFLKIYLTAIPVRGKANKELIKLLSRELNISKSKVRIIKGEKNKEKIIEINDKI